MIMLLSSRERKIFFTGILINSIIFNMCLYISIDKFSIPMLMCGIFILCLTPVVANITFYIINMFVGTLPKNEEIKIIERKIEILKEEIKRLKGENYNDDIHIDY